MEGRKQSTAKLRPEDLPEYQDPLSQALIKGWRQDFPHITDEEIIEALESF